MIGDIKHNDTVTLFGMKFQVNENDLGEGYVFAPCINIEKDGSISLNSIDLVAKCPFDSFPLIKPTTCELI